MSATDDAAPALYVALGRLVRTLRRSGGGSPVGPSGMSALVTLGQHVDGLRLGELAEYEGVSAPSLTRIVKSLDDSGFTHRMPDPSDGRAQLVMLTPAGRDLIASGAETRVAALRQLIERLDTDQRLALEAAVPALAALSEAGVPVA